MKILYKLEFHTFKTDIKGKFMDSRFEKRYQYTPVILTPNFFIVRNTRLTYLFSVPTKSIVGYKIKRSLGRKILMIYITVDGKKKYVQIWPINIKVWLSELTKLGLEETETKD